MKIQMINYQKQFKVSLCLDWFVCYFYIFGIVIALTTMVARPPPQWPHGMACHLETSTSGQDEYNDDIDEHRFSPEERLMVVNGG